MVGSVHRQRRRLGHRDENAHPVPFAQGPATYCAMGCYVLRPLNERLEILENETLHSHKRDPYSEVSSLTHLHCAAKRYPFSVERQGAGEKILRLKMSPFSAGLREPTIVHARGLARDRLVALSGTKIGRRDGDDNQKPSLA